MITVVARWTVKLNELETVMKHVNAMVIETRKEVGNLRYDVYQKSQNSNEILLFEEYKEMSDFDAHKAADYFERLVVGEILPRLEARQAQIFKEI